MAKTSVKILEISDKDWLGGISVQPYLTTGGLFQEATNFDPFEKVGLHVPSQSESRIGVGVSVVETRAMVSYTSTVTSGVSYIYCFGSGPSLYSIKTDTNVVTNLSSRVATECHKGAIRFKNKIVYMGPTTATANSIPIPRVSAEVNLLTLTNTYYHFPHIGPDRNLYVANKNHVARITDVTGQTGNDAEFLTFEDDVVVRGISDDGQHLILVGDTNSASEPDGGLAVGYFRCFVAFWNMKSQDLTRIWSFKDTSVYGVQVIEDDVIVLGKTNNYICNVSSRPRIFIPKGGNANIPENVPEPGTIIKKKDGIALWAEGDDGGADIIYGYGRSDKSLPFSFFKKHTMTANPGGSQVIFSLFYDAGASNNLYAGYSSALYVFSNTTTKISTTTVAGIDFKKPYQFAFAKVFLNQNLASGQSVNLQLLTSDGDQTILANTQGTDQEFSFANKGAKKSHIYHPYVVSGSSSSIEIFEDISDLRIVNNGATIKRIEVWGIPVRADQTVYL